MTHILCIENFPLKLLLYILICIVELEFERLKMKNFALICAVLAFAALISGCGHRANLTAPEDQIQDSRSY